MNCARVICPNALHDTPKAVRCRTYANLQLPNTRVLRAILCQHSIAFADRKEIFSRRPDCAKHEIVFSSNNNHDTRANIAYSANTHVGFRKVEIIRT